jgi:hypothetical protein
MDSYRYRYIFRSTTIVFEITGILMPYSFSTILYRFRFRKKKCENESDLASYQSFPIVFIPSSARPAVQQFSSNAPMLDAACLLPREVLPLFSSMRCSTYLFLFFLFPFFNCIQQMFRDRILEGKANDSKKYS